MNKNQTFSINPTTLEDAQAILDYLKTIGGETPYLTFGSEGISLSLAQEEAHIQEVKHHPINGEWKVTCNGELVGIGSLYVMPRKRMAHRAELSISVKKSHWHQGIGRALLETILDYATKQTSIELLWLEVIEENTRAIALYEAYGFEKVGYAKKFTCVDNTYYGAVLMDLDLKQRRKQP